MLRTIARNSVKLAPRYEALISQRGMSLGGVKGGRGGDPRTLGIAANPACVSNACCLVAGFDDREHAEEVSR